MVQQEEIEDPNLCDILVESLSDVGVNDAAARLQSRGDTTGDNIFEILPRFSVTSGPSNTNWIERYVKRRNEVLAVTGNDDITGVTLGCELLAFEKERDELSKQLHFAALVDMVVWRRSILLIGLSTSDLILVDPSTYKTIFAWKTTDNIIDGRERYFVDAFLHANPDRTKIDLITVSRTGQVVIFREISLSDGTLDATVDQNVSVDVDLGSIKEHYEHSVHVNSKIAGACSPSRDSLILIEESGDIIIVDVMGDDNEFVTANLIRTLTIPAPISFDVVPVKIATLEGHLFVLFSNGILKIGTTDLLVFKSLITPGENPFIHDFTLVTNKNEGSVKIWVLYTIVVSSVVTNYLGILRGPHFSPKFTFKLPMLDKSGESSSYKFPRNLNPYEEPTVIVEMARTNVFLFHILETSTDVTLQKLLSQSKFREAKDLAVHYGKDLDIVRKTEARDILNRISFDFVYTSHLSSGPELVENLWTELLALLREIEDGKFVCKLCAEAQLHRVDWTKTLLDLGRSRVTECGGSTEANHLLITSKMFFTFGLVFPSGTIFEWKAFIAKDNTMYLQSYKFLQNKHFDRCERIWRRHSEDFVPNITLLEFLPFFNVLFGHQLRTPDSVSLLSTVLPFSIEKVAASSFDPSAETLDEMEELNILIALIERQVLTLESKVEWPNNALKFIQTLSTVIKNERKRLDGLTCEPEAIWQLKKKIVEYIKDQLAHLEQILDELAELKRNHSIRILFQDYTQKDIREVVNKLLHNLLSQDEVKGFVSEYLKPYADRKGLDVDFLFAQHITSVIQFIHYYIQAINIPHEERIICLVGLISCTRKKFESALQIAREWPVPWTPGIAAMVERILAVPRASLDADCIRLYDEILLMKKQVPFRCVINKYKLNSSKLCSRKSYVLMALFKIVNLKKPGYSEDCKEILKHSPSQTLIDDVGLEFVESVLRMSDHNIEENKVLPDNLHSNPNLMKALLRRSFLDLQNMEASHLDVDAQELKRSIKIYKMLANESEDPRNVMLSDLKDLIPDIPLDIIYSHEFPYQCIEKFFEDTNTAMNIPEVVENCKKVCKITQTFIPDMLLALGAGIATSYSPELWALVEYIVKTPFGLNVNNTPTNQELLQAAAFQIATTLILQCPELTLDQMVTLQEFYCRLLDSFPDIAIEVGGLLSFFRIFQNLKEQEIPLEEDFLEVCKWLSGVNRSWDSMKICLKTIGETLLKFGELDLCSSVLKTIQRRVFMFCGRLEATSPNAAAHYLSIIDEIQALKNELWKVLPTLVDDEADGQMRKLVKDLNDVGVKVNVYALKIRNKLKLLEKLLQLKSYKVAADLAIKFTFYDNHSVWSRILQGLVDSGVLEDLKKVLERLATVPQLWMLPEFGSAWKKVSQVHSDFMDLCPIDL